MPEPRRWTLAINEQGSVIGQWAPGCTTVEVMPVSEHEEAMAVLLDELVTERANHEATLEMAGELAKAREITDETVDRANEAYAADRLAYGCSTPIDPTAMRAALEAALGEDDTTREGEQ